MPNNPELSLLKQGLCMPGSNKMHAHNLQSFRTRFTPCIVPYQNQESPSATHTLYCFCYLWLLPGYVLCKTCLRLSLETGVNSPQPSPSTAPYPQPYTASTTRANKCR